MYPISYIHNLLPKPPEQIQQFWAKRERQIEIIGATCLTVYGLALIASAALVKGLAIASLGIGFMVHGIFRKPRIVEVAPRPLQPINPKVAKRVHPPVTMPETMQPNTNRMRPGPILSKKKPEKTSSRKVERYEKMLGNHGNWLYPEDNDPNLIEIQRFRSTAKTSHPKAKPTPKDPLPSNRFAPLFLEDPTSDIEEMPLTKIEPEPVPFREIYKVDRSPFMPPVRKSPGKDMNWFWIRTFTAFFFIHVWIYRGHLFTRSPALVFPT